MYPRLTCFLLLFTLGCGPSDDPTASPDALGQAVVAALNAGDAEALHLLRVGKDEYVKQLYPSFPSSRNNFTPDFAWSNLNKKCTVGVRKWVSRFGKKDFRFEGIRFERPRAFYDGFSLLRGTVLTVSTPDGEKRDLKILGSVVVREEKHILLSYDDG